MSILYFWLQRGSGWGSSPLTSPSDHQKLNVIQKWAFYIFGCRGVAEGVWVHRPAQPIIRSWMKSKNEHFILLGGEWWQMGFESINQTGRSSEVERNPKKSILFFWLKRGGGWGSSPSTSPADHKKLNIIQKWAFHFLMERGGRWGLSPLPSPADHQKLNVIQKWAFYFFGGKGVVDRIRVHWPAQLIIKSWM